MSSWSSGYVVDIDYTLGYYGEMNPTRIPWVLANKGLASPNIQNACELGFGQGLATNFHAATSDTQWWGTDFNPSQTAFAQSLGHFSGANLFDESFQDFCNRSDLPILTLSPFTAYGVGSRTRTGQSFWIFCGES